MSRLSDEELIEELKSRFALNHKALHDLRALTAQLEKMNQKLQESEASKGHFLSNIRNEINNPLTSILGLSRHLAGGNSEPARVAEVAGMIFNEAFDLDFQLRNIFIAAEFEAGERRPAYAHVDIGGLVASSVEMLDHQLRAKGIRLRLEGCAAAEGVRFTTDAQMLQVALINLLVNAVEYSHAGGEVTVSGKCGEEALEITVADAGVGIDPADHERIFERFRQMETGATKSHRGHGLGLSIIKAVVDLLDGQLDLQSAAGQGTAFTLRVPTPQVNVPVEVLAQDGNFFLFEEDGGSEVF